MVASADPRPAPRGASTPRSTPSSTPRSRLREAFFLVAALAFLLQPLVIYVAAYHPADCDDKAVHFFSAMHFRAGAAERQAFTDAIAPFVASSSSDPSWPRTAFRLRSTASYPLANVVLASLHQPGAPFVDTVKWGLLVVTGLAVLCVVLVAVATPFGLWPALLTLNLVAWQRTPVHALVASTPANMLPFLSYVPRGAGSLLAIPAVLAFAARRPALAAACLGAVFAWHLGLGLMLAGVLLPAFAGAGLLLPRTAGFHDRALVAGAAALAIALAVTTLTNQPGIDALVQSATGIAEERQVGLRLLAAECSLGALVLVLAARRVARAVAALWPPPAREWMPADPRVGAAALLAVLSLAHAGPFAQVAAGRTGFQERTCRRVVSVALPGQWARLSLRDEASMFLSFGDALLGPDRSGRLAACARRAPRGDACLRGRRRGGGRGELRGPAVGEAVQRREGLQ